MLDRASRVRLFFVSTAIVSIGYGGLALAQTDPSKSTSKTTATNNGEVAQVVVTAQKREQSLTQVPIAISAFTSAERDKIGIDSVQDMTNFTPGLTYNTGNDRVVLRGIGRYTNQLGADSSVGVYEDGAFETFTVKAGNDSIFVDRIEVLRGPQGTLYGRNSIGGAINIISRRPTKDFYGEARLLYDSYGQHIEEGAFSGPLSDNVQFRVAGSKTDQTDGYFKNLAGGHGEGNVRDEYYIEAQLQAQFGTRADLWIKAFNGAWDNGGGNAGGRISNQVIVGPDGHTKTNGFYSNNTLGCLTASGCLATDLLVPSLGSFNQAGVTGVVSLNPSGLNPGNANIRDIYETQKQTVTLHGYEGLELQFNYHFKGYDLKYVGAVQHYAYETHEPWGEGGQLDTGVVSYVSPQGVTTYPQSQLFYGEYHFFTTNEVNLISNNDGPLQWVVGAYNFNESYTQPEQIVLAGQAQLANPIFLNGAPAPGNPTRSAVYQQAVDGAETFAGFGQVDYKVTSDFKATLGLRYGYDSKWGVDSVRYVLLGPQLGVPLPVAFDVTQLFVDPSAQPGASAARYDASTGFLYRKLSGSWSGLTGTAGVQWDPDRDTNLYAKYSRGFKSGGFNAGSGLAENPRTAPEYANDIQVGFKKNIGRAFTLAIDAFYDQYKNAQLPVTVSNGALLSTQFYNMPEARSDGVELEGTWSPTRALNFVLSYGYNDTAIVKSGCIIDIVGDPTATRPGAQPGACPLLTGGEHGQDLKGDQLPNAPKNKVALNATYSFFFEPGTLTFSGSYIWRDEQYGAVFNRAWNLAPSWDQVDLRATFASADHHWTLIAYGKNIFNTTGYGAGAAGVLQSNGDYVKFFTLNPPAVGGVELQYKF